MRKIWFPVLLGIIATPVFWLLGAFLSGGGHSYAMMIVFFPFGMLASLIFRDASWYAVGLPVFAIQFPLYGLLLGLSHDRRKFALILIALLIAHLLAVILCFAIDPRYGLF